MQHVRRHHHQQHLEICSRQFADTFQIGRRRRRRRRGDEEKITRFFNDQVVVQIFRSEKSEMTSKFGVKVGLAGLAGLPPFLLRKGGKGESGHLV